MDIRKIDTNEAFRLLEDPKTRDEFVRTALNNVTTITDEHGIEYQVINFADNNSIPCAFNPTEAMSARDFGMRNIDDLPMRHDDILMFSYPKTGTHWIINLLHYLLYDGPLDTKDSVAAHVMEYTNPDVWFTPLPSPRVMHTHRLPQSLPNGIQGRRHKAVICCRNPKDTVVSLYHMLKDSQLFDAVNISIGCFIENWLKGLMPPMDYFRYYDVWQKEIEENKDLDVLIVTYEALKQDTMAELKRLQAHLGLERSDERLQAILDRTSLKKLRADVDAGHVNDNHFSEDGQSVIYRKGIVGDWKNYFTVAQSEAADEIIARKFTADMFAYRVMRS